ncbi:MAG TPA: FeoA family protein [Verrucomicrobiae bacterium]|nr:FeoA family protein [Verrucomicrobiae bacterium]
MSANNDPAAANSGVAEGRLAPLDRIHAGKTVRIRQLCATPDLCCRLREIGFCEGQFVRLIACHTNIICQVCQARLALNNALARLILVEEAIAA